MQFLVASPSQQLEDETSAKDKEGGDYGISESQSAIVSEVALLLLAYCPVSYLVVIENLEDCKTNHGYLRYYDELPPTKVN
jgi:hypothetical protein